ncbi:hypothetical protein TNCV_267741 [Trichonephila clavipes]|nr:hypothetical protein TNCV_267741 [Trichonephila clavipes]
MPRRLEAVISTKVVVVTNSRGWRVSDSCPGATLDPLCGRGLHTLNLSSSKAPEWVSTQMPPSLDLGSEYESFVNSSRVAI